MSIAIIFFVITALFIFLSKRLILIATVVSNSMLPTLEVGDRIVALRIWPAYWLRKGHVVIIKPIIDLDSSQSEPSESHLWIKRVIATPGDQVYVNEIESKSREQSISSEIVVPSNYFSVNGDANIINNIPPLTGLIPYCNYRGIAILKFCGAKNSREVIWISKDIYPENIYQE